MSQKKCKIMMLQLEVVNVLTVKTYLNIHVQDGNYALIYSYTEKKNFISILWTF